MATFVIVHGSFGGGWEWREVASLLRARGHDVFTPSLTGFAERVHLATPQTGLATHIQDILNLLRYEDLHRVILACQSYGGMVVTAVADRMPERLAHLVYLNALVPARALAATLQAYSDAIDQILTANDPDKDVAFELTEGMNTFNDAGSRLNEIEAELDRIAGECGLT